MRMTVATEEQTNAAGPSLGQWLFNPFNYVAGAQSLILGLVAILVAGGFGALSHTHFDGVIDVHSGRTAPLWTFLAEGLINWLSLAIVLLIVGMLASRSSWRAIDLFGTQALARWPMLLSALATLLPGYQRFTQHLAWKLLKQGNEPIVQGADSVTFGIVVGVILVALIWMVYLMYKAFSVSCNLRGGKAVLLFIAALIAAEVISKIAIIALNARVA